MEGALFPLGQAEDVVHGATEKPRVQFGLMGAIDGAAVEFLNGAVVGVEPVDGVTPDCEWAVIRCRCGRVG